jgi:hypothetical protein
MDSRDFSNKNISYPTLQQDISVFNAYEVSLKKKKKKKILHALLKAFSVPANLCVLSAY